MINFHRIKEEIIKGFPDLKSLNNPFLELLTEMKGKQRRDVIDKILILRTKVYPIIKQEIHLGRAAAIYGVRNGSVEMILYGLISEILDVDKEDYRDIIVEITLLYNGLKFLGENPDEIFKEVIITLESQEADFLIKYLSREDHLKTPESMGYKITVDPEFAFKNIVNFSK